MSRFLTLALSILVLLISGGDALAEGLAPRASVVVVPPPKDSDSPASYSRQPPTSVVVVPPPADYRPALPPEPTASGQAASTNYLSQAKPSRRLKTGMLITGLAVLGASYSVALTVGMSFAGGTCSKCEDIGVPLMVPVVGPFLAARNVQDGRGALVFLGAPQVIGAALALGGYFRYRNSKNRSTESGYVFQLKRGKTLALDVSTSPAMTGPRLDLRF